MDKLWLKHYQQGVPYEIDANKYASLVHLFDETCSKHKNNIAFSNMGSEINYGELDKLSLQFAIYF